MKKLEDLIIIVWLIGALICTAWGFFSIVKFDMGLLTIIFTVGTVFILVHLNSEKVEKETKKMLVEAEELYSLDYSNLKNIKKIELTNNHEYFAILKCDLRLGLEKNKVPHTQFDLELLDKTYENISSNIRISKKEVN